MSFSRGVACLLVAAAAAGCADDLPTVVGPDQFPVGARLTSGVLVLPAADFLQEIGNFDGYARIQDAPYGLVASAFEGALRARTLVQLAPFPDSVVFTAGGSTVSDAEFEYTAGQVVVPVDTAASAVSGPVTLRLLAVAQAWDPSTATWTMARDAGGDRAAWTQPGGALGVELAQTTWAPGDTASRDTIRWQVDSLGVARMAQAGFPGVIVVAEGPSARLQLGPLSLRTAVRPASRPDTAIARTVPQQASTVLIDPAGPPAAPGWLIGGATATRTLLRVTLPDSVPVCPAGGTAPACPRRALRDVTLNEVALVFRPLPTGGGFRPLETKLVRLRGVAEPELGRRAPVGPPVVAVGSLTAPVEIAQAILPEGIFAAPADTTVVMRITQHVADLLVRDPQAARASTAFALVEEPEGETFGYARFAATPQLRIVFTVQQTSP